MEYRVVIIDDEAWTRDTIKRIGQWKKLGFQIVGEAADGISGLECIKELKPHLIIADMKMPGLDGAELLQKLTELNISSKVIVVSGYYDYNYARQALSSHVADYLLKPINEDEFNERLYRCAQELDRESLGRDGSQDYLLGNADAKWIKEYIKVRQDLNYCFESAAEKGVETALNKIKDIFLSCVDKKAYLKLMIKTNYDLQRIIEETVITRYNGEDGALSLADLSFTISENSRIDELIEHYGHAAVKIMEKINMQQQNKKHIDISKVQEYLNENYSQNITLDDMAKRFFVTKEYLSTAFKKEAGVTFSDYLTAVRMEKAKIMILEYEIPIQKVSDMMGYADIAHFYKTFKRYFNTTPGKMREEGVNKAK